MWVISISLTALSPALLLFNRLFIFVMWVVKKKKKKKSFFLLNSLHLLDLVEDSHSDSLILISCSHLTSSQSEFLPFCFCVCHHHKMIQTLPLEILRTTCIQGELHRSIHTSKICVGFWGVDVYGSGVMCWTASCDVTWVSVSLKLKSFLKL